MSRGWNWSLFSCAQQQDERQWAQTEAQEVLAEYERALLYSEGDSTGTGCPERLWSLLSGYIQNPSGCHPAQCALGDPAQQGGLD